MCIASLRPCRVTDQKRHSREAGAGALGWEGPCPRVLEHRAQGGPLGMEWAFLPHSSKLSALWADRRRQVSRANSGEL